MKVGLIDIVIFGTDIEFICFVLWKLHGIDPNLSTLIILTLCNLIEKVEADLRITELAKLPLAGFTVVGY